MYEQMKEGGSKMTQSFLPHLVAKASGISFPKLLLLTLIFVLFPGFFILSHKSSHEIRAFHATGSDVSWFVIGPGYCRLKCEGSVDGLDSCDREQPEKYACAPAEEECQTTCGNDADCLGYAYAADPTPESEADAFNKQDTNCKAQGQGRCIFYEDDAGFEVEISKTTEDRQEYTCTCKAEEDGTCEGAALDEVRNKFLTYLLGSFGILVGLFFIAASCKKCCQKVKPKKKSIALIGPDGDGENRKSVMI